MAINLDTWNEEFRELVLGRKTRMQRAGVNSICGGIAAMSLWPVVEAYQQGHIAALMALGGVLASSSRPTPQCTPVRATSAGTLPLADQLSGGGSI
jgi:hypothetical protein